MVSTVECLCDGCEYEGTISGVEAHVSGSTRGDHKGRSGGEFREQLIEQVEAGSAEEPERASPATVIVASTLALVLIVVVNG